MWCMTSQPRIALHVMKKWDTFSPHQGPRNVCAFTTKGPAGVEKIMIMSTPPTGPIPIGFGIALEANLTHDGQVDKRVPSRGLGKVDSTTIVTRVLGTHIVDPVCREVG